MLDLILHLRRTIPWALPVAVALLLWATGCGSDNPVGPAPFDGKTMTLNVSATDWQNSVLYNSVSDLTFVVGSATVTRTASLQNLNPGDAVRVTVNFIDPLVTQIDLATPVDFYVRIGSTQPHTSNTNAEVTSFHVTTWSNIATSQVTFYATQADDGTIDFFNLHFAMSALTKGEQLRQLIVEFKVPDTLGGKALKPNQTLAFRGMDWSLNWGGDHSTDPAPIAPQ